MKSNYQELIVRQKAMNLAEKIYTFTTKFPTSELYGITSQMRRCSVSIPSNIAEGHQRGSSKFYVNFLRIAKGSTAELETQIMLSQRLGFLSKPNEKELLDEILEILKMLSGLISAVKTK
ncbi:MAG: four helix bundle protein [candidate division SR1 bacterium]|nr:four helix bundle protein [candidate division SR1 bacterium]